jgi:hypothetical protein
MALPSQCEQPQHTVAGVIDVRRDRDTRVSGTARCDRLDNFDVGNPTAVALCGQLVQPVHVFEREPQLFEDALVARAISASVR